jgi:hypothetical protein
MQHQLWDQTRAVNLVPVQSSNVAAVGHDAKTNELHVEFKNGTRYVYEGIDAARHAELMAAPSIGSHLHGVIKPRAASARRIG